MTVLSTLFLFIFVLLFLIGSVFVSLTFHAHRRVSAQQHNHTQRLHAVLFASEGQYMLK